MLLVNRYRYDMVDLSTLTVLGSTSKEHELHTKKSKMIKGSSFLFLILLILIRLMNIDSKSMINLQNIILNSVQKIEILARYAIANSSCE